MQNRREFLKFTGLATVGSLLIPSFLKAAEASQTLVNSAKKVVIIQLSGGNDGLNTIVPYKNDLYYKARPSISLNESKILKLNDELGMNPALEGLKSLYDQGYLSIINNVGYPNPDRSHFRSMDIWQTASDSKVYLKTGWIGRYLDSNCSGNCNSYKALEIDDSLSLAMKGEKIKALAMQNPQKLYNQVKGKKINLLSKGDYDHENENVAYLYKTLAETASSAEVLHSKSNVFKSKMFYPQGELGSQLKTIAELIMSDMPTEVYYVSISGFDTHFNQLGSQHRNLKNYADAVKAFVSDLKQNNKFKDVAILTFSEFGRRVKQNSSGGTDHGTANNVFLISENLKRPKIINEAPILNNLDEGDLKFTLDFRQVYASILSEWLQTSDEVVLGGKFEKLGLL